MTEEGKIVLLERVSTLLKKEIFVKSKIVESLKKDSHDTRKRKNKLLIWNSDGSNEIQTVFLKKFDCLCWKSKKFIVIQMPSGKTKSAD